MDQFPQAFFTSPRPSDAYVTVNEALIGSDMACCQFGTKPYLNQLEQLERLRSEDTPRRPMITPYYWPVYFESQVHIIDQLISDPKSKQGESRKISKKLKF